MSKWNETGKKSSNDNFKDNTDVIRKDSRQVRSLNMPKPTEHKTSQSDEINHTSMVASTGWKWVMDEMWRTQAMSQSPGEAFILSCKTFLRFVKQNPKLYECLLTFPIDETSTSGQVGPNSALEYLTQLASNAYQNVGQPSHNAVGFSRMIWATLLGLANEIIKHKANDLPYPQPSELVEKHIRPKCRLIL